AAAESWSVVVKGTGDALGETPVVVEAPLAGGLYTMESKDTAGSFPAQVFEEGGRRILANILPHVDPRRAAPYWLTVQSAAGPSSARGIRFRNIGRNLRVDFEERLLTEYHVGDGNKPYFFPLVGPTDESYTRAYPMQMVPGEDRDHPHQRSCWFTHGN